MTCSASRTLLFCYLGAQGSHTVGINQPLNYLRLEECCRILLFNNYPFVLLGGGAEGDGKDTVY